MHLRQRTEIRTAGDWTVWRGEDPATGRRCLVKAVRPGALHKARLTARLAAEVSFLSALDHPHVLRPAGLDPAGDRAVFEDVQCSLAQYLAWTGPLPPALVANVLVQAAGALEHLHGKRKGHGCVGPATLLVGPAGDVKVGDFLGYDLGSAPPPPDPEPRYLAPELMDAGFGRSGPAADLYGLGYTALELLAGDRFDRLFGLPPAARWLAWHADPGKALADWRPALSHVPAGLLDVVAGLIPKRPADRAYQSAAQLRAALERSGLTSGQRLPAYAPVAPWAKSVPGPPARSDACERCVGPYVVEELIHRGGRGRLYLGRRRAGGPPVAVRVVSPPADLGRLADGLARATRPRDPRLVRVYRGGAVARRGGWAWFVATEYLSHGSLRDWLRAGGALPAATAVAAVRGAARGLAALHRAGLIHGQITPSAILFDADGRARLGDFYGLPAGPEDRAYQAPEQRAGEPGPTADVYALGVVLHEALTGGLPMVDPAVPRGLRDLLTDATHPDPSRRTQTAAEFLHRLSAARTAPGQRIPGRPVTRMADS